MDSFLKLKKEDNADDVVNLQQLYNNLKCLYRCWIFALRMFTYSNING